MTEFLRWLILVEVMGAAFLPLTFWVFRSLPDGGYAFSKILAVLITTYVTWLLGSVLPIAGGVVLPGAIVVLAAAATWWVWGDEASKTLRSVRTAALTEEVLFIGGLVLLSLMRATVFHPGIGHTEQYMDMSFLGASIRSASYPPFDPWMSGHTINYYYFGYLMYATVIKLSGVAPTAGYNLALSLVFATTVSCAFSVAYSLTRRLIPALLAPLLVAVIGNWHAILVQIPQHHFPSDYFWFWGSTRVVGGDATINEFPYFSFMLGDLHPHVMALPVALLVVGLGCAIVMRRDSIRLSGTLHSLAIPGLAALAAGSLFTINSWDFPTYLLFVLGCCAVNAYLTDPGMDWWRPLVLTLPSVCVASIAFFLPFYAHYKSVAHGIGMVSTPSNMFEFLQVFGLFLLVAVILLLSYALVLQPIGESIDADEVLPHRDSAALEAGQLRLAGNSSYLLIIVAALAIAVFGLRFHLWVLMLLLAIAGVGITMLLRVLNTEEPNQADAAVLLLIILGSLALALTEVIYLRDVFDGGSNYRMNTVFKFYYQAWLLLGVGGAYCVYRAWQLLRAHFEFPFAWAAVVLVAVGVAGGAVYTVAAPTSAALGGRSISLDGADVLRENHPDDYAAVQWLNAHAPNDAVELEATGGEYMPDFARISTFTGLSTVMGWAGHEYQWRGADTDIGRRANDVNTVYNTQDVNLARSLLRKYNVSYVVVGDTERTQKGANVDKFARFMHVAMRSGATVIYSP